ncbi:MAG: 16S rRNA (adenine(1518)-N(6)/adenine(1519)-N(6))-dimethyltransferase RsmA [Desulfomonilia bacterium]|jgi:16S rRNA (adenine1518-N6/adenine1519-N6)-dimethyltransferase
MRPKRSLGQNFLKNIGIAEKMASLAGIGSQDTVVEVGPGRGMLTRVLLKHASYVIAIEKDDHLYESLLDAFNNSNGIQLIHQDILKSDLGQIIPDRAKIVANLPYNIATQLIIRLVDQAHRIDSVVVMLQKEVAQRICAHVGDKAYSYVSVVVAAGFDASPGFLVGPNNFFPKPKVDSLVIKLSPKMSPIPPADTEVFRSVVACAFGQRRKTLKNTLARLPGMEEDTLDKLAEYTGIHLGLRPQDITPEQYYLFSKSYERFLKRAL